jgi:hypothetical protein
MELAKITSNQMATAIKNVQEAFAGEAERLGLKDEDDVDALVKEVRASRKARHNAHCA